MPDGDISDGMVLNVRRRIGEWNTSGLLDAEIFAALNQGLCDLAVVLPEGALFELTQIQTGTLTSSKTPLPDDYLRIRSLDIEGVMARYWPVSEHDTISGPSETNPYYMVWYDEDDVYLLVDVGDPASVAAYVLYYIRQPTTITAAIDPDFGPVYRTLAEDFAVAECLRLRQRSAEADRVEARYQDRIAIINSRYTGQKAYEGEAGDPKLA